MEEPDLKNLLERARRGDMEAFGEMVRRFQDMACGYAYSILGDFHHAEDAAQEAFIEAYRSLPDLRRPEAFPGWFRRIVFKHCDRILRRREVETVPMEAAAAIAAEGASPEERTARRELESKVLNAIRELPEHQREVTLLFYIDCYSQGEIADFLEQPITTVKKRLHDSRKKLKERMMDVVRDTLKQKAPDERFSQKVIGRLLSRPKPLEIEGHPVREIFDIFRGELFDYEYVEGEEVIEKSGFVVDPLNVYQPNKDRILRPETTLTLFEAVVGRTPPVRVFTAGRVFRPDAEDAQHSKVFHQADALCIDVAVSGETMKSTLQRVLESVLGPLDLKWVPHEFPRFEHGLTPAMKRDTEWVELAGCGMLTAETLEKGGFDPNQVSGFGFGLGLERLAMLKYGIDDIRKLWEPPYLPRTTG